MSAPLDLHIERKVYDGAAGGVVEAVRGLHVTAPAGSFTALIGPSGCGKTTSLRILAGLDTAFEGRTGLDPATRIGFVFQEPRLLPWRSVEDNVRFVLAGAKVDLADLFRELGLDGLTRHYPTELSLGLARRVAIARALAIDPEVLLLDEPFTSLDEATAQRLRHLVIDVWRRRRPTALMVTHNVREAILMADRLLLLSPRPSRVVATVEIGRPQGDRSPAFIEEMRAELVRDWPALIA